MSGADAYRWFDQFLSAWHERHAFLMDVWLLAIFWWLLKGNYK